MCPENTVHGYMVIKKQEISERVHKIIANDSILKYTCTYVKKIIFVTFPLCVPGCLCVCVHLYQEPPPILKTSKIERISVRGRKAA